MNLNTDGLNGQLLSEDGQHTYSIWRTWDKAKDKLVIVTRAPKGATHVAEDRSTLKCSLIAKQLGYGGFINVPLYTNAETHVDHAVGPEADTIIRSVLKYRDDVLLAYGGEMEDLERGAEIRELVKECDTYFVPSESAHSSMKVIEDIQTTDTVERIK